MNNEIINKENRIWIFIAYKDDGYGNVPIFSKLFNDHTELKEFSAKHSAEWKDKTDGYNSTYLDLADKSFISTTQEQALAEYRGKIEKMKLSKNLVDGVVTSNFSTDYRLGFQDMKEKVLSLLNDNKIEE